MAEKYVLSPRATAVSNLLHDHVRNRLARVLHKFEGRTDAQTKTLIKDAHEKYQLSSILRKGAACSASIAVATHIAKGVHPDLKAKRVSNLNVSLSDLPQRMEMGSHVLSGEDNLSDTTGDGAHNASAYELYLLLNLRFEGRPISALLKDNDADVVRVFAGAAEHGEAAAPVADGYLDLLNEKVSEPSSETRAKQVYWLAGSNPADDADYHLLAPLYATSLTHAVYGVIHEDRFGETNKAARQARRDKKFHEGPFRDYPNLAVQKLGGTKPQNISQLNSERRGINYLLSCAPPKWKASQLRAPWGLSSVFDRVYGAREDVRRTLNAFSRFLISEPAPNQQTRNRVDSYIDGLIDELVQMAGEYREGLPGGWSMDARVQLVDAEKLWLDPRRAELPEEESFREHWLEQDWPAQIGKRFANWLNARLAGRLPVGDAEMRQWQKELLVDEREGGWTQHLHRLRQRQQTPAHVAFTEADV